MELFHFGFLHFRLLDLIDVFLVAYLLFKIYSILKDSVAVQILIGIFLICFLWWIFAKALHMQLVGTILGIFINVGIIGLIIIFQPEIRRFLIMIGTNSFLSKKVFNRSFLNFNLEENHAVLKLEPILKACAHFSKSKTGALIIITRNTDLKYYINTGEKIEADLSAALLENIFFRNSPLHDGAVIIDENKIIAARCLLPVTESNAISSKLGTRHRAAIGISEHTDALAIVVSEETGAISIADEGELKEQLTIKQLEDLLQHIEQ